MAPSQVMIDLHPTQKAFRDSDTIMRGFVGGRGAGKSFIGTYDLLRRAKPGRLYGMYAPTYPMLRDATLRSFLATAERIHYIKSFSKGDMIITLGNGAQVMCRSLDDPERARGPNLSGALIDEASLTGPKAYEIIIACLRENNEQGWLSATFTPKGMRHWTYEVFGKGAPNTELFRATTRDNPFLPSGFADVLQAQYSGEFAKQELEGEFVAFEGLVYSEFDRAVHVLHRDPSEFRRYVVGVDEGYTNPAVALVWGVDSDDRAHIVEEFYQSHVQQGAFVEACLKLHANYHAESFYVDPSAAGLIAAMRSAGLPARPANNAVNDGIQTIKGRLAVQGDGRPRLTIEPTCVNTISEFESYVWAKDRDGNALDKPEKENDHAMDAGRYAGAGISKPVATRKARMIQL